MAELSNINVLEIEKPKISKANQGNKKRMFKIISVKKEKKN